MTDQQLYYETGCALDELQFELEDEESGLRALFCASEDRPGEIRVSIWDGGKFACPTEAEVEMIDRIHLTGQIRCELVFESGSLWESWAPHALDLRARLLAEVLNPVAEA